MNALVFFAVIYIYCLWFSNFIFVLFYFKYFVSEVLLLWLFEFTLSARRTHSPSLFCSAAILSMYMTGRPMSRRLYRLIIPPPHVRGISHPPVYEIVTNMWSSFLFFPQMVVLATAHMRVALRPSRLVSRTIVLELCSFVLRIVEPFLSNASLILCRCLCNGPLCVQSPIVDLSNASYFASSCYVRSDSPFSFPYIYFPSCWAGTRVVALKCLFACLCSQTLKALQHRHLVKLISWIVFHIVILSVL